MLLTPFKQNLHVSAITWSCLVPRSVLADLQSRATGEILVPRKGSWERRSPLRQLGKLPCSIARYSLIDGSRVFYLTVEAPRNQAAQGLSPQVLRLHTRLPLCWVDSTMGMFWGRHRYLVVTRLCKTVAKNLGLKHSPTSKRPISLG